MKWISVKDKLPKETDDVLVCFKHKSWVDVGWMNRKIWNTRYSGTVTHWMPLPKPPKEQK